MAEPTVLAEVATVSFPRDFHVEILRGGMNRLLLRSYPTADEPTRVEVFFQYVQYVEMPMSFRGLTVHRIASGQNSHPVPLELLGRFPMCTVFRLESDGEVVGHVAASACVYGEDSVPLGAPSMFPMMTE